MIKAMMNQVPLDPEKKVTSIPTSGSASTPTSGAGKKASVKEVPLDPNTVKKSDLIAILEEHTALHGGFDMEVDAIANFLINE